MPSPLPSFPRIDLYQVLHLPRTATSPQIRQSYLKIALALHPDRHSGCPQKSREFQKVAEAYKILSDRASRGEYDRWLFGSRAAERNPWYRKVYSPRAPPGMKTFDPQRHFDMHYGDGIMKEEIERVRRRAETAGASSYQSPLGRGFQFQSERGEPQGNPYSRRQSTGSRFHGTPGSGDSGDVKIEYEEAYINMNRGEYKFSQARQVITSKEFVVERMKNRRKNRVRERGEPNPYLKQSGDKEETMGCVIM